MLIALGYSDRAGEFNLSTAIKKAEEIELIPAGKYITESKKFYRGDCVDIIYSMLAASKKGDTKTMAEVLIEKGAISAEIANKYGFGEAISSSVSAQALYDLGVFSKSDFSGTPILSLGRAPTKLEVTIMYIRMLGKEE